MFQKKSIKNITNKERRKTFKETVKCTIIESVFQLENLLFLIFVIHLFVLLVVELLKAFVFFYP